MHLGRGEICALLAPLAWSVAVMFYKKASSLPPASMNLFKNSVAIVLLGVTMLVAGISVPMERSWGDWARLVGSGVIGLALGDTLLFAGLARIGAARLAVVDTVYAPLMVFLSWAVLGEDVGGAFLAGAVAVVIGIAVASGVGASRTSEAGTEAQRGHVLGGMVLALGAIACTCVGVVLAKPALASGHLVEITWTRLVAGTVVQAVVTLARGGQADAMQAFVRRDTWRHMVPGALVGTYLSLLLWLGGFKWGDASVASVLNQMATVYMLLLARLVLGEELRPRQVGGALVAAMGAAWIVVMR